MDKKKYKINVEIFGESYAIKGDADPARMMQVAAVLDERMKEIAQAYPRLSQAQVAVLAALNIADEYFRLEEDYNHLVKMANRER